MGPLDDETEVYSNIYGKHKSSNKIGKMYNGLLKFIPKYYGTYNNDDNLIIIDNLLHGTDQDRISFIDIKIGLSTVSVNIS